MLTRFRSLVRHRPARRLVGLLLLALPGAALAQSSVGVGTATPDPKAALDISATDKGLLIPRMDSAQRVAITPPPDGLMVFQTTGRRGFWYAVGGTWYYIPDKTTSGDNLGSHTATQPLQLNGQPLTNHGTAGLRLDDAGNAVLGSPTTTTQLTVAGVVYQGTYGPNLAPGSTITASSVFGGGFVATKATDNDPNSAWSAARNQSFPQWLALTPAGGPVVVRRYEVVLRGNDAAGTWQLQGSPDGTTWTTLHTASATTDGTYAYNLTTTTAYAQYRLNVTAGRPAYRNSDVTVREWRLMTENATPGPTVMGPGTLKLGTGPTVSSFAPDGTLAGNSDAAVPTQQAVKTYVDAKAAAAAAPQTLTVSGQNLTISGGNTVALPADNLGNHTATQPIGYTTNDADKLLFTQARGASGSKISHSTGWSLDYYAGPNNAAAGQHRFLTGTGTGFVERMRLDAAGNLGIGTPTPATTLDVVGTARATTFDVGLQIVTQNYTLAASFITLATITCPTGKRLVSGSGGLRNITATNFSGVTTLYSGVTDPMAAPNTWSMYIVNTNNTPRDAQIQCTCANVK